MAFVNIRLAREVTADDPDGKKQKIARRIVETLPRPRGSLMTTCWLVFEEVAAEDWRVGQSSVAARRKAAAGK